MLASRHVPHFANGKPFARDENDGTTSMPATGQR
jgi:hypothetical protein